MARKRASSSQTNGTAPAETIRTNGNSISVQTVQLQAIQSDKKANPIVCSFPGGLPESLQPNNDAASSVSQYDPPQFEWHRGAQLRGHDEACQYTSINNTIRRNNSTQSNGTDESLGKRQTTQLAVGIYDKKTGKVELHLAAENGAVFCLQQHVSSYVSSVASNVSTMSTATSAAIDYRALYEDFGSAKKKRVLQSQEANRVTVQDDENDMDETSSSSGWDTTMSESNRVALTERRAVLAATASLNGGVAVTPMSSDAAVDAATMTWRRTILLPPFSLEATTPIDIYKASDICGKSVWQWARRQVSEAWATKDVAQSLWRVVTTTSTAETNPSNPRPIAEAQWTESVRDLLDRIPYTSTKRALLSAERISAVQHQLCCAVVLHHFVSLYKLWHTQRFIPPFMIEKDMDEDGSTKDDTESPRKQRPHSAALSTPLVVRQRFLTAFGTVIPNERPGGNDSNSTGYAMSKVNVDCCLVHILLLYLVAHHTGESKETHDNGGTLGTSQRNRKGNAATAAADTITAAKPLSADHVERLVNDLRMERIKAVQLVRQAGCTVTRVTTSSASSQPQFGLVLSTPLTFPPPRRKKAAASTAVR